MPTNRWIERATRRAAKRRYRDRFTRPKEWFQYQDWDDDWRSEIMDQLAKISGGFEPSFAAGAVILLAGWQAGYDG